MDEMGIDLDALLFSVRSDIEIGLIKKLMPKEDKKAKRQFESFVRPFVKRGIPVSTALEILQDIAIALTEGE